MDFKLNIKKDVLIRLGLFVAAVVIFLIASAIRDGFWRFFFVLVGIMMIKVIIFRVEKR